MRVVDDGLGTIHVFTGTKSNGKQFQELMKDYRYLEQEIVDLKKELIEEKKKDKEIERLQKENVILKHRLNDIVFDDANDDVELGARFLRKIGYVDFDEERKVYINKHNKEPFWQEDEREKGYYIPDEELNEYTEQLENKLQQKENIIKEVREYIEEHRIQNKYSFEYDLFQRNTRVSELLEILDKVDKKDITIPLEELESYETKNIYEEAEQDYFWSKE